MAYIDLLLSCDRDSVSSSTQQYLKQLNHNITPAVIQTLRSNVNPPELSVSSSTSFITMSHQFFNNASPWTPTFSFGATEAEILSSYKRLLRPQINEYLIAQELRPLPEGSTEEGVSMEHVKQREMLVRASMHYAMSCFIDHAFFIFEKLRSHIKSDIPIIFKDTVSETKRVMLLSEFEHFDRNTCDPLLIRLRDGWATKKLVVYLLHSRVHKARGEQIYSFYMLVYLFREYFSNLDQMYLHSLSREYIQTRPNDMPMQSIFASDDCTLISCWAEALFSIQNFDSLTRQLPKGEIEIWDLIKDENNRKPVLLSTCDEYLTRTFLSVNAFIDAKFPEHLIQTASRYQPYPDTQP